MNHVHHVQKLKKRDIFKDKQYDWLVKLIQRLKKIFIKFCKSNGLRSPRKFNYYNVDFIEIALSLGPTPGDKPLRITLDHIKPISLFDFSDIENVNKCWSSSNLCWLPRIVNSEKGNKFPWHPRDISKKTMKRLNLQETQYLKLIEHKYETTKKINNE